MGLPSLLFQLCSQSNSKRHLGILLVEQLFLCGIGTHRRWGALWGPNSDKKFLQTLFYYSSTFSSSQVTLRHHNKNDMCERPFNIQTLKQIHTHTSNHTYTLYRVTRTRITAIPAKQSNTYNGFSNKPCKSSPKVYFSKHSVIFSLYLN